MCKGPVGGGRAGGGLEPMKSFKTQVAKGQAAGRGLEPGALCGLTFQAKDLSLPPKTGRALGVFTVAAPEGRVRVRFMRS